MSASPTQVAELAWIVAEQAQGLVDGRFEKPAAMQVRMRENITALGDWASDVEVSA